MSDELLFSPISFIHCWAFVPR